MSALLRSLLLLRQWSGCGGQTGCRAPVGLSALRSTIPIVVYITNTVAPQLLHTVTPAVTPTVTPHYPLHPFLTEYASCHMRHIISVRVLLRRIHVAWEQGSPKERAFVYYSVVFTSLSISPRVLGLESGLENGWESRRRSTSIYSVWRVILQAEEISAMRRRS